MAIEQGEYITAADFGYSGVGDELLYDNPPDNFEFLTDVVKGISEIKASTSERAEDLIYEHYLTFYSPNSTFYITPSEYWGSNDTNSLKEYNIDNGAWQTWTTGFITVEPNQKIRFRGTGISTASYHSEGASSASWEIDTTSENDIEVSGNIETILDYKTVMNGSSPALDESCYLDMFNGCVALNKADKLEIPSVSLNSCEQMFYGCTSLTTAPALPATTLAEKCYYSMFRGCTSLETAPALPATILAEYCYYYMFYNCTSLASAPVLPATTLASYCYYNMFYNCQNLTSATELPATELADYCYYYMFRNCISLTSLPSISGNRIDLAMFYNCKSLPSSITIPSNITTIGDDAFFGCTSLSSVVFASTTAMTIGTKAFCGCTSLSSVDFLAMGDNFINCTIGDGTNRNVWTNCILRQVKITKGNFADNYNVVGEYSREWSEENEPYYVVLRTSGGAAIKVTSIRREYYRTETVTNSLDKDKELYVISDSEIVGQTWCLTTFYSYMGGQGAISKGSSAKQTNWNMKSTGICAVWCQAGSKVNYYGLSIGKHSDFDFSYISGDKCNYNFTTNGKVGEGFCQIVDSLEDVNFGNMDLSNPDYVNDCIYPNIKLSGDMVGSYIDFMIPLYTNRTELWSDDATYERGRS